MRRSESAGPGPRDSPWLRAAELPKLVRHRRACWLGGLHALGIAPESRRRSDCVRRTSSSSTRRARRRSGACSPAERRRPRAVQRRDSASGASPNPRPKRRPPRAARAAEIEATVEPMAQPMPEPVPEPMAEPPPSPRLAHRDASACPTRYSARSASKARTAMPRHPRSRSRRRSSHPTILEGRELVTFGSSNASAISNSLWRLHLDGCPEPEAVSDGVWGASTT